MNKAPMSHDARVELYCKIIKAKLGSTLTDFNVALMRNAAPTPEALSALNDALIKLGWPR